MKIFFIINKKLNKKYINKYIKIYLFLFKKWVNKNNLWNIKN